MRIRNVILDWSGTLVNDLPPVFATTNYVLQRCGLAPLTLEEFRTEFCLPVRRFYERRTPGVPMADLEKLFLARYAEVQHEITLLPHAREFLQFCRNRRFGVFIASSVDPATYERQTHRLGLAEFITKPYIGVEDKTVKIHHILEENNLKRQETLLVGDMEHDIAAGKAGGVHTCAVLSGYTHAHVLRALEPDLVCAHLGELQMILAGEETGRG